MRKLKIKAKIREYAVVCTALILSLSAATVFAGDWGYGVVIANGGLNLRESASTQATVLTVIPDSTVVSVNMMTPDGRWYDVTYNGFNGYVSSDYFSLRSEDILSRGNYVDRDRLDMNAVPADVQPAGTSDVVVEQTTPDIPDQSTVNLPPPPAAPVANPVAVRAPQMPTDIVLPDNFVLKDSEDNYEDSYNEVSYPVDAPEGTAQQLCDFAAQYLGTPYLAGGDTPDGFDCSGFVQYIFSQFGYSLPRTATDQCDYASFVVDKSELIPGDLLFFKLPGSSKPIGHVGIYVGDNMFIHATNPGDVVKYSDINLTYYVDNYVTAKRILP